MVLSNDISVIRDNWDISNINDIKANCSKSNKRDKRDIDLQWHSKNHLITIFSLNLLLLQ